MDDKYLGMILSSFVGDSLALGAHWIYDTQLIASQCGNVDSLKAPLQGSYHSSKDKGDFTHYGDQTLLLLQSVAKSGTFRPAVFTEDWQKYMMQYTGYIDKASKETLANLEAGKNWRDCGAASAELGGAARIAPLFWYYRDNFAALKDAARKQTGITHNSQISLVAAEFLCKLCWEILHGATLKVAIELALADGIQDIGLDMGIRSALEMREINSIDAIKAFGQSCGTLSALPGVIHIVVNHEHALKNALSINVMAGGDSASRGLVIGMILGALNGKESIPPQWFEEMNHFHSIINLLQ